ncbi:RING-type E3 ubiquitin transferase [Salvia divinorum]|uniref:RING-type E3 ubiquitin transferase n=1 Tax=Salvia divinorum TaxID=28513 RepID=A0ABD1IG80_SALDI
MDVEDEGGAGYDYCSRHITFQLTGAALRRSMLRLHRLKFNFFFRFEAKNWNLNPNSAAPEFTGEGPSRQSFISAAVTAQEAPSYEDTRQAIVEAVDDLLTNDERHRLVQIEWREACEKLPAAGNLTNEFKFVKLDFVVRVERRQIIVVDGLDPATEMMLEKCEMDCVSCCCICLEEFGGGGAVRMPCTHVFHGGCIERWLRNRRCCPLCRHEMPAAKYS